MADFYGGASYPGIIRGEKWITSQRGSMGLQLDVELTNADGVTKCMFGKIWFSEKTMQPRKRKDGTVCRSMAQSALEAVGFEGT